MSSNNDQTGYNIQANIFGSSAMVIINIVAQEGPDFTDADFLAAAKAIEAAMPAAWQATQASGNLQVFKQEADTTMWGTDLSADAPVFS